MKPRRARNPEGGASVVTGRAAEEARGAAVSGGGGGLGRVVALVVPDRGWALALAGRRGKAREETAALSGAGPDRVRAVPTDVAEPDRVTALFCAVGRHFGRLDLLGDSTGAAVPAGRFPRWHLMPEPDHGHHRHLCVPARPGGVPHDAGPVLAVRPPLRDRRRPGRRRQRDPGGRRTPAFRDAGRRHHGGRGGDSRGTVRRGAGARTRSPSAPARAGRGKRAP